MRQAAIVYLLAACQAVLTAWGVARPERGVPGDALVGIHVPDVAALRSTFGESPLRPVWCDPEIVITAPLREGLEAAGEEDRPPGPPRGEPDTRPAIYGFSLPEIPSPASLEDLEDAEFACLSGLPEDPRGEAEAGRGSGRLDSVRDGRRGGRRR